MYVRRVVAFATVSLLALNPSDVVTKPESDDNLDMAKSLDVSAYVRYS